MNDPRMGKFVSKFLQWSDQVEQIEASERNQLKSCLNNSIKELLPSWDTDRYVEFRVLSNSKDISMEFMSENFWLFKSDKNLISGVLLPFWNPQHQNYGFRFSQNPDVSDMVGDFFRYASNYVSRSRIASLVGAIAIVYDKACDFRYEGFEIRRVNSENPECESEHYEKHAISQDSKSEDFESWAKKLNCLDPFVHRAVYQFWRATKLMEAEFFEESITPLDSCVSVIAEFIKKKLRISDTDPRDFLFPILGLDRNDYYNLKKLYKRRYRKLG